MKFNDYEKSVYEIIGAAMAVQKELKWGLLEPVYKEALHLELWDRDIENEMEKGVPCYYKNRRLEKSYRVDLVVDDIIVELKSVKELLPAHRAQLFNYLRLTKMPVGVLINFGQPRLQGERYGFIESTNECVLLDRNMNILRQDDTEYYDDVFLHECPRMCHE